jgi:hypothetical protein
MKKLIGCIVAIAMVLGVFSSSVFAGGSNYVYDSENIVGSARLTAQVKTDGVLMNTKGGTVIRTDSATFFECGGGVWVFRAIPAKGYVFDGWETLLTWEERDWRLLKGYGSWESFQAVNPERVKGSYWAAVQHISNRNGDYAFHPDGTVMGVHHVWCSAPMATQIRNVQYNIVAKFRKVQSSLTVNHYGKTYNQFGELIGEELIRTDSVDITYLDEGAELRPDDYKIDYGHDDCEDSSHDHDDIYRLDREDSKSVSMVYGENTLNIYYEKTKYINQPVTLKVKHIGYVLNEEDEIIHSTVLREDTLTNYVEKTVLTQADLQNPGGFGDYWFEESFNTAGEKTMVLGENEMEVYYIRGVRHVSIAVDLIGITLSPSGEELKREVIGTNDQWEQYTEGNTVTSNMVKGDDKINQFQYDPTRDETLNIPFYEYNPEDDLPVASLDEVEDEEEIRPDEYHINVYYVYQQPSETPTTDEEEVDPIETIEDEEVAPIETIEDEETPLAPPTPSPQTGDATPIIPLFALLTSSSIGVVATKLRYRRKK